MSDRRLPAPVFFAGLLVLSVALVALMFVAWQRDDVANAVATPTPVSVATPTSGAAIPPTITQQPSSPPSPTAPSPPTPPSATPTLTPTPTPTQLPGVGEPQMLDLSEAAIYTTPYASNDEWFIGAGSSAVAYRAGPYRHSHIETMNVVTGATAQVPGSEADFLSIERFDSDSVIWLASRVRYSPGEDATPGGNAHANYWQIVRYNFGTRKAAVIASGTNRWLTDDSYVHDPDIGIDGDVIAYDTELSGRGKHVEIVVRQISTGDTIRTIQVDRPVFEITVSGEDVTYESGDIAKVLWNSPKNPQRVVSHVDGTSQKLPINAIPPITQGGYVITVDSGDRGSAEIGQYPIYATGSLGRMRIGTRNLNGGMFAGEGLVVWAQSYGGSGCYGCDAGLTIFDTQTGRVALLDSDTSDKSIGLTLALDDGWLFWTTLGFDSTQEDIHAISTADIHAAFEASADGQ